MHSYVQFLDIYLKYYIFLNKYDVKSIYKNTVDDFYTIEVHMNVHLFVLLQNTVPLPIPTYVRVVPIIRYGCFSMRTVP